MEYITAAIQGGPKKTKAECGIGRVLPSLESLLRLAAPSGAENPTNRLGRRIAAGGRARP
jgi:hypothetical protein